MDESNVVVQRPLKIFAVTLEQSAEAILKQVISPIQKIHPNTYFEGVVSKDFSFEEFVPFIYSDSLKIMGLIDVVFSLYRILKIQKQIIKRILEKDFDLVVTVDSSSFHLPLVNKLKKAGCKAKFVHAVCPPIWAYRPKRKTKIAATFDLLLPLFQFEKTLFEDTRLDSFWIGHPFQNQIENCNFEGTKEAILIFPGSRKRVIERNLPLQLAAAKRFNCPIFISVSSPSLKGLIEHYAPKVPTFEKTPPLELRKNTLIALATSGTITLELALMGIPTVVTYKIPLIDAIAAKLAKMNVPFFALPNLLANKELFIELIHPFTTVDQVSLAMEDTLKNPRKMELDLILNQIKTSYREEELVKKIIENSPFQELAIKGSF